MSLIERNSLVTLHYCLGLTNGDVLEDNFDDEPITVQLGCGEMAEGLELALTGLTAVQEETIDIGPELAFGFVDETLFRSIQRVEFDPGIELEPGLIIEFATEEGETLPGTILEFNEDEVHVDLNHPLAGQTVRYGVKIVAVDDGEETKTIH
jgi:FKBP-type peptidyl-prolyl cis-trans isomerase SlpA